MNQDPTRPILEMRGIVKTFPGVHALSGVDFELHAGEIHALLGENGAGKSTLIKVLGGVYAPDAGAIHINGEPAHISSPIAATRLGIAIIHQELNVIPALTVADNILLGQHPRAAGGLVDERQLYRKAQEVLDQLGLHLSPTARVGALSATGAPARPDLPGHRAQSPLACHG